jgi:hypothetical protein
VGREFLFHPPEIVHGPLKVFLEIGPLAELLVGPSQIIQRLGSVGAVRIGFVCPLKTVSDPHPGGTVLGILRILAQGVESAPSSLELLDRTG